MEPMQMYALLHLERTEEARRIQLEQHFVARDHARTMRRERLRALRRWLAGPSVPAPTVEFAV